MNNLNRIYEKLKQSNPNTDDRLIRQQAWVIRDKIYENSSGGSKRKVDSSENSYVETDYVDDYFE